jgi:colanic acid biosynthesis protein WcaH
VFISEEKFKVVLDSTPLVSIDLLVEDEQGRFLLGYRKNRPAQHYWFVPGGRIQKNESLDSAFKRLTKQELGTEFSIEQATLLGPFDHFYDDCVFGSDISTHYVAIAYRLKIDNLQSLPDQQHSDYCWEYPNKILINSEVHHFSKKYFNYMYTPKAGVNPT